MELKDKVVVVTGAASGIGLGLAARFVAEGATVVASDIAVEAGTEQAERIGARFVPADVGTEAEVKALVECVLGREGRIDLFCSNAGFAPHMDPMSDQSLWDAIVNVNFNSQLWAARHVLPHMLERGQGYLLNTASAAGLLTELGNPGYAATKHACVGLAEWLAFAYADRGIRVSVLCPEGVRTPILDDAPYLLHNAITVEELADTVVEALHDERFMIATHSSTLRQFQQKAADYEGYIEQLMVMRKEVVD
ncbi:SDR family oxidoreductase [Streptomyces sp. NPDC052023]|uniref:SDR family oxidoreductase n=1 Tax=Streptomyces sp. NPDC052023 TaxID=3365681 RepID=UPI0037CD7760